MKRFMSLFLILLLLLTLAACGSDTKLPDGSSDHQQSDGEVQDKEPSNKSKDSNKKLGAFSKDATLDETVMVDEDGVKITATGLDYTNHSVELKLILENNSGKNLSFVSGSAGYSCNSINGYMMNGGYLNCDVAPGKKASDSISFDYNELMLFGINEIADMEIGFDISDDDYAHTYTGPRQVKTSAFDSHDYSTNHYQATIGSPAAMNTYEFDMKLFSQDVLYDEGGIKLVSSGVMVNRDGETMLLLELENSTSNLVYITTSNISLNGLVVYSSTWSRDTVNPGKRSIVDVNLPSVFDSEYWNVYGLNEIGSITLLLTQYDSDEAKIADAIPVDIIMPDASTGYDPSGKEVYNNNGLTIVAKTVLEDPSNYSDDMHVLLLAENNSGKALVVDDIYDSLSVNGFMTDYSFSGIEIQDGEGAALDIELQGSSLADNQIASASDVKEIEMGLEIKDGRNTLDEPTITVPFE